jgi:hypothetical protein
MAPDGRYASGTLLRRGRAGMYNTPALYLLGRFSVIRIADLAQSKHQ